MRLQFRRCQAWGERICRSCCGSGTGGRKQKGSLRTHCSDPLRATFDLQGQKVCHDGVASEVGYQENCAERGNILAVSRPPRSKSEGCWVVGFDAMKANRRARIDRCVL